MINSPSYIEIQGGTTHIFALSKEQMQLQHSSIRLICKTGGGAIAINLPKISDFGTGLDYAIIIDDTDDMAGTNNITIYCDPINTIENATSYVINTNGAKKEIIISSLTEFAVLSNGGTPYIPIIPILYADLYALMVSGMLVAGQKYLITDFATRHVIPFTVDINTGAVEPLIVEAISVNQFSQNATSLIHTIDEILYEIWDTTAQGGDKGRIRYRKNTRTNIECFYDWRSVKFRRWETALGSGVFTVFQDNGFAFVDLYTFNNESDPLNTFNVKMAEVSQFPAILNNNVFGMYCEKINIGINSINNTIGGGAYSNNIGAEFSGNVIGSGFRKNNILFSFSGNTISNLFDGNTIGHKFERNIIANSFINNEIGNNFNDNITNPNFENNIIGNECYRNLFGQLFSLNKIGNYFYDNETSLNFTNNNFGNYFILNTIIGNDFQNNIIGNYFQSNVSIGVRFIGNVIGVGFSQNTINDDFADNVIGNYFMQNTTGNIFQYNTVTDVFKFNVLGNFTVKNNFNREYQQNLTSNILQNNIFNTDLVAKDLTLILELYQSLSTVVVEESVTGFKRLTYFDNVLVSFVGVLIP